MINSLCVLGTVSVDLADILKNGSDIINTDVNVDGCREGSSETVVGKLNISVEALALLTAVTKDRDLLRSKVTN